MDWAQPLVLVLVLPLAALVAWFHHRTVHPMSQRRRRLLMVLRTLVLTLTLLALAGPAWQKTTEDQAVVFVMDHSQSQGVGGMTAAYERANALAAALHGGTYVGFVSAGASATVRRLPARERPGLAPDEALLAKDGHQSDLAAAVALAGGLFPAGTSRRVVLVGDGVQTRGDLERAARDAAVAGVVIDAVPIAGAPRPDVRLVALRPSRSRLHEGASLALTADVESSLAGEGRIRLFENGIEVDSRPLKLAAGAQTSVVFRRTPERRSLYTYRARVEGFAADALPENDEAMTLADVRGRPLLLYVEGEHTEARYLADAMAREGIRLDVRPPHAVPDTLQDLAGYDGVIISDVPAHKLTGRTMALLRDYVERLGGGFLMIGGKHSFGAGGYWRTPIEDILPVKLKPPDTEERASTALALVVDRSGSMSGHKVEICKSAAIATVDLLEPKDHVCVVAFDSQATLIVPTTRVSSKSAIAAQIAAINADGGTNMYPGMTLGYDGLGSVRAKAKHMIVLSDGQTEGSGFQALAAQMRAQGITVSTVAVGDGADVPLLQGIAAAGGGKSYVTLDPANIPQIFTQDAMVHLGRVIREEAFAPRQAERHPMLRGWAADTAPLLLGCVKTRPKATAQVPLVTDTAEPLLAHWRFGLGKVTAFTSDCTSRWAALWITAWPSGYAQFWSQVLRETAREPQGEHMDIRVEEHGQEARAIVDLLEDPAQFRNQAAVDADVFFIPAHSLGSSMEPLARMDLQQEGPGRYSARFRPDQPGVYLIRARCGSDVVSAGIVHNVSGEAAAGRINLPLLQRVCELTGGTLLRETDAALPAGRKGHSRFIELAPLLLAALLAVFLADLAVRRWENILGMAEAASRTVRALTRSS
ncbi:MAG: VWA domain-containing protein [Planctomycetes bacterium]|nr:VWA domain-containing protein [Planctomycetota bacterium]